MTEQVTPIRFYGQRERERLEAYVRACVVRWQEQWCGNDSDELSLQWLEIETVEFGTNYSWFGERYGDGIKVHMTWSGNTLDWLLKLCVGSRGHGGKGHAGKIGRETLERILSALCHEIAAIAVRNTRGAETKPNRSAPPTAALRKNGGYVWFRVNIGGQENFMMGVPPELAKLVTASPEQQSGRSTLSSAREAIGAEQVHLVAFLGEAVVALSELQRLSCGDVIRLDQPLGDAIRVQVSDGQPLGAGHLGASGNYRAVQMVVE